MLANDSVITDDRLEAYRAVIERVNAAYTGGPIDWPRLDEITERILRATTMRELTTSVADYEAAVGCGGTVEPIQEMEVTMGVKQDRRANVLTQLVCPECQSECHFNDTAVICTNSKSCSFLRRIIKTQLLSWRRLVPESFTGNGREPRSSPASRECPGQKLLFADT
jgi:hypothetical protein